MSAEVLLGARRRPRRTVAVLARHLKIACKCEAQIGYDAAKACAQGLKATRLDDEARAREGWVPQALPQNLITADLSAQAKGAVQPGAAKLL